MEPIYLEPSNSIRWQKKVVILTNRRCYSATNDFVNAMRSIEDTEIIQLGDRTGGWFRSSVLVRTAERLEHPLLRQPAFR